MLSRRSLKAPIILAVVMIVLLVALTVGWVLLSLGGALRTNVPGLYWTLLAVGSVFFLAVLSGVVLYLNLSVKTIGLTQRQSNFIDSVTHELKSPIASLKLYAQTLNRHNVDADERRRFYRFMLEDIERLDRLINHVLDAARLEKPRAAAEEIEEVDLALLLRGCVETLRPRYSMAAENVHFDLQPCLVRGRLGELEILFRNLIDNAMKYSGAEPRVWITLRLAEDGWAVVRVADNGRGVPRNLRRKVFGRFIRLGSELERETPGAGLGLHIVQTLVKRMKGRIRVEDRAEGPGALFEVRLPGAAPVSGVPSDSEMSEVNLPSTAEESATAEATR